MKIAAKITARQQDMLHNPPATIAFIGDSVTQGCFECQYDEKAGFFGSTEPASGYAAKLQTILHLFCPDAQINIINAGIGGDTAAGGLARFDRDVGRFSPDLVVVAFALNDSAAGPEGIPAYVQALEGLFAKAAALGAECILLTPNAMNDRVSPHLTDPVLIGAAESFMHSCLGEYAAAAKQAAVRCGVTVCDVYAKWQSLRAAGVNTTELLANKLNHPIRQMHWLPAFLLAQAIFEE